MSISTTENVMAEDRTRVRLSTEQFEQLDRQIRQVLEIDNPQTLRNVYYKQCGGALPLTVPKTAGEYERISARLCELRAKNIVPYEWVSDGRSEAHV